MDNDNDGVVEQSMSVSSATMACRREERNFFFLLCVFFKIIIILFFASSTDLATCSFDHSCKEPTEMEIEK